MPPPKRGRAPRRALNPQEETVYPAPPPSGGRVSRWLIALILILSTVVIVSSLHVLSKMSAEGGAVGDARSLRGGGDDPAPAPSTLPPAPAPGESTAPAPKKKRYFCSEWPFTTLCPGGCLECYIFMPFFFISTHASLLNTHTHFNPFHAPSSN